MNSIIHTEPLDFPWKTQDPFIFCAYHRDDYPKGNGSLGPDASQLKGRNLGQDFRLKDGWRMYHGNKVPGFPYHPHRGFETITINKKGVVDHTDSLGAAGRFMTGDVQWMTAGKGIQHSEMFPLLHDDKKNTLEIFQIWLNLPRMSKMVQPHFKMLWAEDVPVLTYTDKHNMTTKVHVITGSLNNVSAPSPTPSSWASDINNAVGVYTLKMEANAVFTLPKTIKEATRSLFFYKGKSIVIDDKKIPSNHLVELHADTDITINNGPEEALFLILEGRPIGEPVAKHGPFVMNTPQEIREAMKDYGRTQFGGWPWPETEMVHPKGKGRFAKYSDGTEEQK